MTAYIMAGVTAGFFHAVSGPDHLAAIAPLAVGKKNKKWRTGFMWGMGHSFAVIAIGLLALAFRTALPLEALSMFGEKIAGVALVAIGFWGLRRAFIAFSHSHKHSHNDIKHEHAHLHIMDDTQTNHKHSHTAFFVGMIHGVAGSHFVGALPAVLMPLYGAILYLVSFGVGAIIAMSGFSAMAGFVGRKSGTYEWSLASFSALAVVTGVFWIAT
ncbi:hypothetical protein MNBD_NITROSPINAE01-820 [hydrothermal vent metagenome]|uniref:Nickel transporter UreH n=1 Tax=hydrothermal vent metagenome TaxID=652676 RepID=A0A3B1CCJ0_9ZZZZ